MKNIDTRYGGPRGPLLRRVDELWLESVKIRNSVNSRHYKLEALKAIADQLDEAEDGEALKALVAIIEKTLSALPETTIGLPKGKK